MTKLLTLLTSAILVLLLVAFGIFLVRDKPAPTPVAKDPVYEAAIAPPESLVSAPPQSPGETSVSDGQPVVVSSDDDVAPGSDGVVQPVADVSPQQEPEIDRLEVPSSSSRIDAGQDAVSETVRENGPPQPEVVLPNPLVSSDEVRVPQSPDPLPRTYTVRAGDSLSSIAKKYYGNPALWKPIRDANPDALGKGVRQIRVGKQLTIPPLNGR